MLSTLELLGQRQRGCYSYFIECLLMAINYALLGKYLAEMYEVQSIEERFQIFSRYLQILGFTGATYTFAPTMQMEALRQLPMVFLRTDTFPTEFLQDYSEKRFDRSDFTVRKVLNGETHPMDWREYELTGELLNEEIELIRLARERYGILNAISIPTTREHGAAGMSVISNKDDDEYKKIKQEQMDTLLAMVRVFHDINFNSRNWPNQFIAPVFDSLTDKERMILRYLASGSPMKRIKESTGISKNYADNLLLQLRRRLGVPTTNRLMYLFGLLSNLYDIPKDKQPPEE